MSVRLNKFLAESGVCARRKADELIAAGDVTVDGRRARVGESIDPARQRVVCRGKLVRPQNDRLTLVLNKPPGIVTTLSDERGRKSVRHLLPASPRLFPVGRLDAASSGVLLCTSDGELAKILTHPSFGVEKRYRVRAAGPMTSETVAALGAVDVRSERDGTHAFDVVLHEGKNRQVRRMCAQRGLRVLELRRVCFGPVELRGLAPGKLRALTKAEREALERIRQAANHGM